MYLLFSLAAITGLHDLVMQLYRHRKYGLKDHHAAKTL